jgi:hypothetical protein
MLCLRRLAAWSPCVLQAVVRMLLAMKRKVVLRKARSATVIRARFLAFKHHKALKKTQASTVNVQAFWRGARVRLAQKRALLERHGKAATRLQVQNGCPSTL